MLGAVDTFLKTRGGLGVSERAGMLAASTSVGRSFSRGLLPRATADQAVITGASSAINYAATAFSQSLIEAAAYKMVGGRPSTESERLTYLGTALVGDVVAIGLGVGAQKVLAQRKDEPIARAWSRTALARIGVGGLAGALVRLGEEGVLRLDAGRGGWASRIPVSLPMGALLATVQYQYLRRSMADAGVSHDAEGVSLDEGAAVSVGRSVVIGTGVSLGIFALAMGERTLASGVAHGVNAVWPQGELLAKPIGHLAGIGLLAGLGAKGVQRVFHKAEHSGDAVEAAYQQPPTSEFVSGGPRSAIAFQDIGREGRRFVNMALTSQDIKEVMGGEPMNPIRVFVGLESAETTSQRADLAMRELEALGAFERSLIVFMSPTGTGYLNYVTAEALEYLTGGDIAMVAMQYSLRPSPMSLGRVGIGVEQNSAFLHALKWRLQAIPEESRPRLAIFGESLGAHTSEDVFADEGVAGLHRAGVDRTLFLGTPYAAKWRQRWLSDPERVDPLGEVVEVDSYEEFLALPQEQRERARYFLLTHHNDPMPKFWFPLAVQKPTWMGPPETREPGLPKETAWRPYTTFLITLIDVKNAMHVVPGQFVAWGHDYRKDLARFTSVAYNLPVDDDRLARMERALRARELQWAERRVIDQQLSDAAGQVREQLAKWGVPQDQIPTLVGAVPAAEDELAAN